MRSFKRLISFSLAAVMALSLCACNVNINDARNSGNAQDNADNAVTDDADAAVTGEATGEVAEVPEEIEKNGDVIILFTSDIHCGVDQGFGLAGVEQVRETYESQGYTVLLVDDGDAVQGESIGTVSKGESIIQLMNDMKYDVAIPGNHEFDYGMERFLELTEMADFPYISCNFRHEGETVFDPYI
ncbi:MAG: metallophosphoesterase, partial [Lachnospiraceae bacterium]|nr:metallophosphoesterase [Lachnospiraceae bacterium]